eukprot:CAMPEP_0168364624 /NCGR_PEP_ID=MMETSP0228-20121227/4303_1 /TAXON_ID=133427 /ORGANISM="Protoceratium reticulatum, Strain CCCM 535 (=CCMP 1889)" /LENGTH=600 /DNA_ID=CAMNT_0008377389 /DNA_START=57 /DNA_END=1859 /DNA_ORIENTATION=+
MKSWIAGVAFLCSAHGCFVPLDEPSAHSPIADDAVALMRQYFLDNLNVNGTGAVIASPGPVPVLDKVCNSCGAGYAYHWTRDGALSILALQRLVGSELATVGGGTVITAGSASAILRAYVEWVRREQSLVANGGVDHADPKWNISTGEPYQGNWCRPQTDGPALRAQALMSIASDVSDHAEVSDLWSLITFDLDWLANGTESILQDSCDIWEENPERNFFWNRVGMRAALLLGHKFAMRMGDHTRSSAYLHAAEAYLRDPLIEHLQKRPTGVCFIAQCPPRGAGATCHEKGKSVDGAVIVGLAHTERLGLSASVPGDAALTPSVLPTSAVVAQTVETYNGVFCALYPINRRDTEAGIPGVLYGRYIGDQYGSDGLGNPWQLISAALASIFYQAAQVVARGGALTVVEIQAWQTALNWPSFAGLTADFVAAGDAVLQRIAAHVKAQDRWHLYEQIDKETGGQLNARDLTWSYAEVLDALLERGRVWPRLAPAPESCSGWCRGAFDVAPGPRVDCARSGLLPDAADLSPDDALNPGGSLPEWPQIPAGLAAIFIVAGCAALAVLCNLRAGTDSESGSGDLESEQESSSSSEASDRDLPGLKG